MIISLKLKQFYACTEALRRYQRFLSLLKESQRQPSSMQRNSRWVVWFPKAESWCFFHLWMRSQSHASFIEEEPAAALTPELSGYLQQPPFIDVPDITNDSQSAFPTGFLKGGSSFIMQNMLGTKLWDTNVMICFSRSYLSKGKSFFILAPQVSKVQSRSAIVSWTSAFPSGSSGRSWQGEAPPTYNYELQLTDKGRDGKYKVVYR